MSHIKRVVVPVALPFLSKQQPRQHRMKRQRRKPSPNDHHHLISLKRSSNGESVQQRTRSSDCLKLIAHNANKPCSECSTFAHEVRHYL